MPYDKDTGRWKAPYGAVCGQCNSLGYVVTEEVHGEIQQTSSFAWKCDCTIGKDRNLKYPKYGNRDWRK